MASGRGISWGWFGKQLRNKFFLGILVIVPVSATIWLLIWVFNSIDHILQPVIKSIWGHTVPGVGFGIVIVLIFLAGIIASNIIGKRIIAFGETLLDKVPLIRQLYGGIKQVLRSFVAPGETGFMQVVFVEFPRKGMRSIGFVTNKLRSKSGDQLFTVFIPTAPNPTTGFLQIVKEDEIIPTNIKAEDAIGVVISAGRVSLGYEVEGLQP
jgi:uncharacterized membrane protein